MRIKNNNLCFFLFLDFDELILGFGVFVSKFNKNIRAVYIWQ